MAGVEATKLIEAAAQALRDADSKLALSNADEAIALDPSAAEAYQMRGIALTRLGRLAEATEPLRRASELAPHEPKHRYNLAVNLSDRGEFEEAKLRAREAIAIDPSHAAAAALLGKLGDSDFPHDTRANPPQVRAGYGGRAHVLPFMYGMERVWNVVGYAFLGATALLAVLMIVHFPAGPVGKPPAGQLPDIQLKSDLLSVFTIGLYMLSGICSFMWILVDVIDRQRKFLWFIPLMACGTLGFGVLPLALYIFVGRRIGADGVST